MPARKEQDPQTIAISALNEKIHKDERVDISLVPFADGVTICRVK
jgi:predicted O-methyltransferase YrrM